jgi:hypothetical protein
MLSAPDTPPEPAPQSQPELAAEWVPPAGARAPASEPAEIPDMGLIATEALLARAARNWAQIAAVAAVIGYLLGIRRRRRGF